MKSMVKQILMLTGILFVGMLAIDMIIARVIDKHQEKNPLFSNIEARILDDMDGIDESADAVEYSEILGREFTKEESNEQRILEAQKSLLIYNNIGLAQDFMLPDGNW